MPTPTSPSGATDGSSVVGNNSVLAPHSHSHSYFANPVVPHAPQPRRAASYTPYAQHPRFLPAPIPANAGATTSPLRLFRLSVPQRTTPARRPPAGILLGVLAPELYGAQALELEHGGAYAYGGDSEFSPSHSHSPPSASNASAALSHTLSRLEGRSTPSRERDPEHEALRARLERVLALNAASGGWERAGAEGVLPERGPGQTDEPTDVPLGVERVGPRRVERRGLELERADVDTDTEAAYALAPSDAAQPQPLLRPWAGEPAHADAEESADAANGRGEGGGYAEEREEADCDWGWPWGALAHLIEIPGTQRPSELRQSVARARIALVFITP
ncbi:hypothetical protein MVEN_00849300 [Mycena venus]|uniref:Uncharacterized protein n=1 Tax=Mycena venus TaxID=2733690 RepID=A0A8H6YF44_9AGAR|nr:hypothetical protein MVEN_00849300 [Mycena venus]